LIYLYSTTKRFLVLILGSFHTLLNTAVGFDVLLPMHLSIILENDQRNAQILIL